MICGLLGNDKNKHLGTGGLLLQFNISVTAIINYISLILMFRVCHKYFACFSHKSYLSLVLTLMRNCCNCHRFYVFSAEAVSI